MRIFAGTANALALHAVFPATAQARGVADARRREQEHNAQLHRASPKAIEDQVRRQNNLELIRDRAAANARGEGSGLQSGSSSKNKKSGSKSKTSKDGDRTLETDVVIGGVGYAGAKLGEVLAEAGVDFVMAEASDRIGGRMYNVPFGAGDTKYSIEVGAQWIDGIDGSPNWDLAVESGLGGAFDTFTFEIYDENGDRDLFEESFEEGSECLDVDAAKSISDEVSIGCFQVDEGEPLADQALCDSVVADGSTFVPGNEDDISVEQTWDLAANWRVTDRPSPSSARNCQTFYHDFEQGLAPYEVSTKNSAPLNACVDFGDGDYFIKDLRGFAWLPRFLDERLKMQHKIVKVKWDPEGKKLAVVTICLTERVEEEDQPVTFPCKKGSQNRLRIKAKDFVSTFSSGVLRESIRLEVEGVSLKDSVDIAPRFIPPLTETIEGVDVLLGYRAGIYNKAFFQFPKKFWTDPEYMLSAYADGEFAGDYAPIWANRAIDNLDPDSNILWLYSFSDRAFDLDQKSDDEAIEELLPVLNGMFAENITDLYGGPLTRDDVDDFYLTRWSKDPLFWGGFDVEHINVPKNKRFIFNKRYGNLMFSGVYSCDRHNGWTHGGQLAGERSGIFLLKERYGFDGLDTDNICDDGTERTPSPTNIFT